MITKLKNILGPKCTAISVNTDIFEFINVPSKQMKFCESVNYSFKVPLRIDMNNLECPGARHIVGFDKDKKHLAKTISENNHIPVQFIINALNVTPTLSDTQHINLGLTEHMENDTKTDLYIAYVEPGKVTFIMHTLAKHKIMPSIPPYSLLSVCGNVFANCYINQSVSISFGCPESRKYGGIEKDDVVIGIPYKIAQNLIRNYKT